MPVSFYIMNKEQSVFRRIVRKIRIPFLASNATAKFLFLLLSVFLWFLIKLSKEGYVTEFNFPVKYTNIPQDMRLNNEPVSQLKVRVRSHGFDLLKYKLRSFRAMDVDVTSTMRKDGDGRYYWDPGRRKSLIDGEFDDETQVLSVSPDTVFFEFNAVKNKKVKVYLKGRKLYSNFKTFYSPPEITPDSIRITGAEADVNKIDSIFTKAIDLKAEEDSVTRDVALDLPKNSGLEFSASRVKVKLRYTSLTEGSFSIPVSVINLPEGYQLNVFPEKINLRFQVPVQDYDRVSEEDFIAYVDYQEIEESEDARFLTVRIQSAPAFLRKVTLDPRQLEYILIKK